jgi:hypothetical protein
LGARDMQATPHHLGLGNQLIYIDPLTMIILKTSDNPWKRLFTVDLE